MPSRPAPTARRAAPHPSNTVPARGDSWGMLLALVVATIALGYANQTYGERALPWRAAPLGDRAPWLLVVLGDRTFPWLTASVVACMLALTIPPIARIERQGAGPAVAILAGGVAFQLYQLWQTPPDTYLRLLDPGDYETFANGLAAGLLVVALLLVAGLGWPGRLPAVVVPLLLLTHFLLGAWLIGHAVQRQNDVFIFQQESVEALLRGENPYAITFPDLYADAELPFYGPGLTAGGRTTFGFPYPPLSLLLALPGQLLGGDLRYGQLVAMTLSGALLAYARPGRLGLGATALLLFTPRVFHILDQAWTEPFVVLLLAATIFCACRIPRAVPFALGLFLASKQYLVFAAPLVGLLLAAPVRWRALWPLWGQAGLVVLAVSLPLVLGDPPGFANAVVILQFLQPLRLDALSYPAIVARAGGPYLPNWIAFAALLPALGLALRRRAGTPTAFAAAVAFVALIFFAFNKQAFNNYYFLVLGALCGAIAAAQPATEGHARPV